MQKGFFLRINEGPYSFLLARDQTVAVESRQRLQSSTKLAEPRALAWLVSDNGRWPVLRLADLLGFKAGEWNHAVFVGHGNGVYGIAAEDVQLTEEPYAVEVRPFTPVGIVVGYPIFRGASVEAGESILVLDGDALQQLAAAAKD